MTNPVLSPGSDTEWDRGSIRGAAVIHDGAQFRMWYAAVMPPEYGLDDQWNGVGAAGSFFRTEVEINNAGMEPAEYRLAWFPRGEDNSQCQRSGLFRLGPRNSVRHADVLSEVFGLGPGSFGALAVEATTEDLLVAARILSSDDGESGSYGQDIPTLRPDELDVRSGNHILFGAEHADARFNVTCFHGGNSWAWRDVGFALFDTDGRWLETRRLRLAPWGSDQINRIFGDHRPVNGSLEVRYGWGTYCFGSVLDNHTNDATTILPKRPAQQGLSPERKMSCQVEGPLTVELWLDPEDMLDHPCAGFLPQGFLAYASKVDNLTGDAEFLPAVPKMPFICELYE